MFEFQDEKGFYDYGVSWTPELQELSLRVYLRILFSTLFGTKIDADIEMRRFHNWKHN